MEQIKRAAAELAAEMERQGRSEAVVYMLDPAGGFHPLTEAMKCLDVLLDIEGDVDMAIGSFSLRQMQAIGAIAK